MKELTKKQCISLMGGDFWSRLEKQRTKCISGRGCRRYDRMLKRITF